MNLLASSLVCTIVFFNGELAMSKKQLMNGLKDMLTSFHAWKSRLRLPLILCCTVLVRTFQGSMADSHWFCAGTGRFGISMSAFGLLHSLSLLAKLERANFG